MALFIESMFSLNKPIAVLQFPHIHPLNSPLLWLWSKTIFLSSLPQISQLVFLSGISVILYLHFNFRFLLHKLYLILQAQRTPHFFIFTGPQKEHIAVLLFVSIFFRKCIFFPTSNYTTKSPRP